MDGIARFAWRLVLVVIVQLLLSPLLFAQDDFFLSSPREESSLPDAPPVVKEQIVTPQPTQVAPEPVDDFFGNAAHPSAQPEVNGIKEKQHPKPSSLSAEEDERAIPVKSIGLIVEADGSLAQKSTIARYYQIIEERGINPSELYVVLTGNDLVKATEQAFASIAEEINKGQPEDTAELEAKLQSDPQLMPRLQQELLMRMKTDSSLQRRLASAFTVLPVTQIPSKYNVTKLPTWILLTDQGKIVLEGLDDPSRLLTMSGKFVEPLGVQEEEPTPGAVVKKVEEPIP